MNKEAGWSMKYDKVLVLLMAVKKFFRVAVFLQTPFNSKKLWGKMGTVFKFLKKERERERDREKKVSEREREMWVG